MAHTVCQSPRLDGVVRAATEADLGVLPAWIRGAGALVAASALLALLLLARCVDAAGEVPLTWELGVTGGTTCYISYGALRRNNGYISYGALRRDNVPCSVRDASYYNCRQGAQSNPYSRGCSAITRCRG